MTMSLIQQNTCTVVMIYLGCNFHVITVKLLWYNLYCKKRYLNKGYLMRVLALHVMRFLWIQVMGSIFI